jgi:hypothetical protein
MPESESDCRSHAERSEKSPGGGESAHAAMTRPRGGQPCPHERLYVRRFLNAPRHQGGAYLLLSFSDARAPRPARWSPHHPACPRASPPFPLTVTETVARGAAEPIANLIRVLEATVKGPQAQPPASDLCTARSRSAGTFASAARGPARTAGAPRRGGALSAACCDGRRRRAAGTPVSGVGRSELDACAKCIATRIHDVRRVQRVMCPALAPRRTARHCETMGCSGERNRWSTNSFGSISLVGESGGSNS